MTWIVNYYKEIFTEVVMNIYVDILNHHAPLKEKQ